MVEVRCPMFRFQPNIFSIKTGYSNLKKQKKVVYYRADFVFCKVLVYNTCQKKVVATKLGSTDTF